MKKINIEKHSVDRKINHRNLNRRIDHHKSVVNGTIVFSSEPFHGFFFGNSVLGSDSGFTSSSQTNSASWSLEDDVKVHTENTSEWIILNTQIDVFLNTESETSFNYYDQYLYQRS